MRWLPWILAIVWLAVRWAAGEYTGYDFEKGRTAGVLANLLIILVVLFGGLISRYKKPLAKAPTFMEDVRTGAGAAMKYVIGVTAAMALWYFTVSPELPMRRDRDHAANAALIDTPEKLEKVKQEYDQLKTLGADEILAAANERTDLMTSPGFIVSSSFIGLLFTALLYSFLGAFIFRQFIRREPAQ